jgi:hypothetical protein
MKRRRPLNEELTWLSEQAIESLFRKYDEGKLRETINWLDEQSHSIKAKVKPILERELNRRAIQAYESRNNGEWI